MVAMQNFCTWFLTQLPTFFMSEPVCYLWGIALVGYILKLIVSLRRY